MAYRGDSGPRTKGRRPPTKDEILAAAQGENGQSGHIGAIEEVLFVPANLNVIVDEQARQIRFSQFIAPAGPNLFMKAYTGQLSPDVAIEVGEFLVEQGRRLKTGLVVPPAAAAPADLRG